MNDQDRMGLLDYPPLVTDLQSWTGAGQIRWREREWECQFALSRLLNGRLRVIVEPEYRFTAFLQTGHFSFELDGIADNGARVTLGDIHITRQIGPLGRDILLGFARKATLRLAKELKRNAVFCELSNYSLHQRRGPVELSIKGFDITIEQHRRALDQTVAMEEHASAYQHAAIRTYLGIKEISRDNFQDAISCLHDIVDLQSIAFRGYVFVVGEYVEDFEAGEVTINFQEAPFSSRAWGRPLVPSQSIEEFLVAAHPQCNGRIEKLELSHIVDHYLQALTLRSIWPRSVGIFTAMETLKSAYFRRNDTEEASKVRYWVPPFETFRNNRKLLSEVVDVLAIHDDKFMGLTQSERDSLRAQIYGLNRRSYITQLRWLLSQLAVEYENTELRLFIDTRNDLIHRGTPVPVDTPLEEFEDKNTAAWEQVRETISLFERTLLAFLNYSGPRELYRESVRSVN
ncbi:MAG: hypothetical protein ACOC9Z_05995 [Chloroflexota bacterium]